MKGFVILQVTMGYRAESGYFAIVKNKEMGQGYGSFTRLKSFRDGALYNNTVLRITNKNFRLSFC